MVFVGGFASAPIFGKAQTSLTNFTSDFEARTQAVCGIEPITFRGTTHFSFKETVGPNGEHIHQFSHLNFMGGHGIGEITGKRYTVTEAQQTVTNYTPGTDVVGSRIAGTLTTQGEPGRTHVTVNLMTTFDSDGQVHTVVEYIDFRCDGEPV